MLSYVEETTEKNAKLMLDKKNFKFILVYFFVVVLCIVVYVGMEKNEEYKWSLSCEE